MPRKLSPIPENDDNSLDINDFKNIINKGNESGITRKYEIGYLNFKDKSHIELNITYVLYLNTIYKTIFLTNIKVNENSNDDYINLAIYYDSKTRNYYLIKLAKYSDNISSKVKLSIISSIILKEINKNNNIYGITTSFKTDITPISQSVSDDMPQKLEYIVSIKKVLNPEKSVKDVFLQEQKAENPDYQSLINILLLTPKLYNYLIDIGINYGFMHNNLNLNNVIYDDASNELLLTDFSYSTFAKYFHNQPVNENILDKVKNVLYKIKNSVYEGFTANDDSKDRFCIKKKSDKYFGTIFDLISFTLNIYSYFIYYAYTYRGDIFDELISKFKKILTINYNNNLLNLINNNELKIEIFIGNIEQLIKNYEEVKVYILQYNKDFPNYYTLFIMILEGLFYANLFIKFIKGRKLPEPTNETIFSENFQIKIEHKPYVFSHYIETNLLNTDNAKFINDNLSYLKHFINSENKGGSSRKTSTKRILKKK